MFTYNLLPMASFTLLIIIPVGRGLIKENVYIMCDFDLPNLPALVPYLPSECQEVYNDQESNRELYNLYLQESKQFAKFFNELRTYELQPQSISDKEELHKYEFKTDWRNESYTKVDLGECLTIENITAAKYLLCCQEKYKQLSDLIP